MEGPHKNTSTVSDSSFLRQDDTPQESNRDSKSDVIVSETPQDQESKRELEDITSLLSTNPKSEAGTATNIITRQLGGSWHDSAHAYVTEDLTSQVSNQQKPIHKHVDPGNALNFLFEEDNSQLDITFDIRHKVNCVYDALQEKNTNVQTLLNAIVDLANLESIYGKYSDTKFDDIAPGKIKNNFKNLNQSAKEAVCSRLSSIEFKALVGLIENHSIKTGGNMEVPHDLVPKMKKLLMQFQNAAIPKNIKLKIKQPSNKDCRRVGNELNAYFHDFSWQHARRSGEYGGIQFAENDEHNPIALAKLLEQEIGESGCSKDFENELLTSKFLLEYPDGNRMWLTDFKTFGSKIPDDQLMQKRNSTKKLRVFCERWQQNPPLESDQNHIDTRNNLSPLQLISFLANSKGMKMDHEIRELLHSKNKLPLPRSATITSDTGVPNKIQTEAAISDDLYVIKAHEDGSFTVKLHSITPLTYCFSENSEQKISLNPHFSHWNTRTEVKLPADGAQPSVKNFGYDYAAVANTVETDPEEVSKAVKLINKQSQDYWEEKLAIPIFPEIPPEMDFDPTEAKRIAHDSSVSFMRGDSDNFDDLMNLLIKNKECFDNLEFNEMKFKLQHLKVYAIDIREAGSDLDAMAYLSKLNGNHESLLAIINRSAKIASGWQQIPGTSDTEGLDLKKVHDRLTTCHAFTQLAADLMTRAEGAVCDFRAAADEHNICGDHLISKIENASLQSSVAVKTLSDIFNECVRKEEEEKARNAKSNPDYHSKQIKEFLDKMTKRTRKINKNLAAVQADREQPMNLGPGITDKKFKRSSKAIVTGLIKENKKVPIEHGSLSQAQLASLGIKVLVRKHPKLKATLRNYEKIYARNYVAALEAQNWSPIVNDFNDFHSGFKENISEFGTSFMVPYRGYKMLRSTVTPAPSMRGEINFTENYDGKGMPSCNRIQAKHVNNLAHSQLSNRQDGKVMFAGLRHGFVDAYDIRPETMSSATDGEKQALLDNVGNANLDLESFRNTRGIANVRASANDKIAKELVAAAVIADPVLLQNAKEGKPVRLNLDSVLLGSPDVTAFPRNSGKADHRLQANQRAALTGLGDQVTIPMKFPSVNGGFENRDVNVALSVRSYTFPFSRHALSKNWLVKLFVKPFINLRRADRVNEQAFSELLGPLDSDYIGGDVAAMANYLLKQTPPALQDPAQSATQQAEIQQDSQETLHSESISHQEHILSNKGNTLVAEIPFLVSNPGFNKDLADNIEARLEKMSFESREDLAKAILTLARDTKRILRERIHHGAVQDPCMLAARVSMLSYLLGRTPAYSCKNGMYRTGMLDTSIKLLAADTAAKIFPMPEQPVDSGRNQKFSLCTGNLRLQHYNKGRSGYNPKKYPWQMMNLRNQFGRQMLIGDSK